MDCLKSILPSKLFEVVDKADISTPKQIMVLSIWDIKRLTYLSDEDIILLKDMVADFIKPQIVTANILLNNLENNSKITSGCNSINNLLGGGYRRGCITEIYGESGSGKTQLGIQAVAHNWPNCCIYICTEDLFPIKRFNSIKQSIPNYNFDIDYGKNIYVEHITESQDLLSCVRVRVPKLLSQRNFSTIIIDSIAAPFRVDNTNYIERAEELRALAMMLISMSQEYNLAVICINQVTGSFDTSTAILPSLGLAWSNMVSTRLYLEKTAEKANPRVLARFSSDLNYENVFVRKVSITYAPDLPIASTKFIIITNGVQGLD